MRAGILDESAESDLEAAIRNDPTITERQKQTLLDVYRSFRHEREQPGERSTARRLTGPASSRARLGGSGPPGIPGEP